MFRALGCWLWAVTAFAQTALLDLVMPDAKAVFAANVARLRSSPLVQTLWSGVAGQDRDVAEVTRTTGFDPLRDLDELLMASAGGTGRQNALLLARGSFARLRLIEVAQARGASVERFQGVEIVTATRDKEPMAVALLEASLLAAGDPASVRGAIARRARPAGPPAELRRRAAEWAGRCDAWFVSMASPSEFAAQSPDPQLGDLLRGEVIQAIEELAGGIQLDPEFRLLVEASSRSEDDAARLASAVRFFLGLAQAQQPSAGSFLQDVKQEGRRLHIEFSIPAAELEKWARLARSRAPARKAAPPAETGVTIYSSPSDMGVVKIPAPKPQ